MTDLPDVWVLPLQGASDAAARATVHSTLRRELARKVGVAADALLFCKGPHGKPALLNHRLAFNISRRGGLALIAVAPSGHVGVDLEQITPLIEQDAISAMFHPAEQAHLLALPRARRRAGFFHIWTRKEAVVKVRGIGLSPGLQTFSTLGTTCDIDGLRLHLHPLGVAPGFAATFATDRPGVCPRLRPLTSQPERSPA